MSQAQPQGFWERVTVTGDQLADKVSELIHEGNVRHLVIKHGENTVLEIPVTLGVLGAVLAPTLAAVAAVGAILTHCTIEVNRTEPAAGEDGTSGGSPPAGEETSSPRETPSPGGP
jgi:hypothetical protein